MKMTKTFMVAFASMVFATGVANASVEHDECKKSSSCKKEKAIQLNKFSDNWFIGIGGGISNYYGNYTANVPFGKRISPTFSIQAGKWSTPFVGFRANFAWSKMTSVDLTANNPAFDSKYENVYKTKANMLSLSGEALFDVTNMIWGYNQNRVYSFIPYLGVGWVRNCDAEGDRVAGIVGLLNQFKLNDKFALNLDAKLSAFGEGLDRAKYAPGTRTDLTTSFTVGATYFFGKRNFDRAQLSNCQIKHMQENLKKLNAEKAALEEELTRAKNIQPEVKEVVKTQYATSDAAVFFSINKSDLTNKDRVNLGFIADMIKKNSDKVFVITGYADKATGSAAYNDKLSAERAQAIYDVLVNEFNVNASQLEINHMGGVDNMFYDKKQLSRVAIIKMK